MIWLILIAGSVGLGWLLGGGDAAANVRLASAAGPEFLLTTLLGITTGLCARDRIRLRRTYASPTLAYLGKGLHFAALAVAATAILSPVAWAPYALGLCAALTALGAGIWLGNLPPRL